MLEDLEDNIPPRIMVPASLIKPDKGQRDRNSDGGGGQDRATPPIYPNQIRMDQETTAQIPAPNPDVQKSWQVPTGMNYRELFYQDSPNLDGWPKLPDPRNQVSKCMCVKFQVNGKCNQGCYRSHQTSREMAPQDKQTTDKKFANIYAGHRRSTA